MVNGHDETQIRLMKSEEMTCVYEQLSSDVEGVQLWMDVCCEVPGCELDNGQATCL